METFWSMEKEGEGMAKRRRLTDGSKTSAMGKVWDFLTTGSTHRKEVLLER